MAKEVFSSREMLAVIVAHYETLLVQTGMLESDQPFVAEALESIGKVKEGLGNRCFLTRRMMDELYSRDILNEDDIELEEERDDQEDVG